MSNRITSDPAICHGKPCIRSLRYPVESVLEWLAGRMTIEEILLTNHHLRQHMTLMRRQSSGERVEGLRPTAMRQ